jgi:aminoglycoside phosphotransferase (APT) family kinase protein
MPPSWTAEITVLPALARALIEDQFPQLGPVRADQIGAGWDNTAYHVNESYIFRFPRRQFAVPFLETESRVMPWLGPRLLLPAPVPIFVGRPVESFPWPFVGHAMLPGRTACSADLDDRQRAALARPLAQFLRALHAIPVGEAAANGAGFDTIARLDVGRRVPRARERLDDLARRGIVSEVSPFVAILDAAPAAYTPRTEAVVHGDLYARHLLVDDDGQLAGVIDWGDVHLGDPAVDLAIAYTFLPPEARTAFFSEYGLVDDTTRQMARLRGLWHTLTVLEYAHAIQDRDLMREGGESIRHLDLP